jgi:hypothetical protein
MGATMSARNWPGVLSLAAVAAAVSCIAAPGADDVRPHAEPLGLATSADSPGVAPAISKLWTRIDTGIPPVWTAAMAYDEARARTILFGGLAGVDRDDTWAWDGSTWSRLAPATRPLARHSTAMVYDSDRKRIVLFGGSVQETGSDDATWEWDGVTWTRLATTLRPAPRIAHAMAYDAKRKRTVLFGGNVATGSVDDTWEFDGTAWSLVKPPLSPGARGQHAMAYEPTLGKVVLFGGRNERGAQVVWRDTWTWDGAAWKSLTPAASPEGRFAASLTYDGARGKLVLVGGRTDLAKGATNDAWTFDGATWSPAGTVATTGRQSHATAFDAKRGRTVLFGGFNPDAEAALGDTWEWDGAWTLRATAGSPGAVSKPAMTYDGARGRVVMLRTGGTSASTWEYDGARWAEVKTTKAAPNVADAAIAYDAARKVVVVAGGTAVDGSITTTSAAYTFDGAEWRTAKALPEANTGANALFDPRANVVRIVGGTIRGQDYTDAVLDSNGVDWVPLAAQGSLPPRAATAIAYDTKRGVTVLFGGSGVASSTLADTWELDAPAKKWTAAGPPVSPAPRNGAHAVFDPLRARTVLYGGRTAVGTLNDMWEWDGSAWTPRADSTGPTDVWFAMTYDGTRRRIVAYAGQAGETWEYQSLGEACASGATCASGNCVDGACCAAAACGSCASCRSGTCDRIVSAEDPDSCAGATTCDAEGRCLKKGGTACAAPAECASASCVSGVCCEADCGAFLCAADGKCLASCTTAAECASGFDCAAGRCVIPTRCVDDESVVSSNGEKQSCAPFRCKDGACGSACATSDDCVAGWVCDEAARCIPTPGAGRLPSCSAARGNSEPVGGWIALTAIGATLGRRRAARRRRS